MKYFYCVFKTHLASICEKKESRRYALFNTTLSFYEKNNIHSCGLNKSSKTCLNQWESVGFNELSISKSNSILKRNSISKSNSMSGSNSLSKSNSMLESNLLSESNSIWESNSISKRIRYGKGIRYRNRTWYRKGTNHKSLRNEWPQWASVIFSF